MRIAFLDLAFPKLSHTFVLNQITGLIDLGHEVEVFAFRKSKEKAHPCIKEYNLIKRVHYVNAPKNLLIRFFGAVNYLIRNFHKNPSRIIRSFNIFIFGRFALSLNLFYLVLPFLDEEFDIIQCHFGEIGKMGVYLKRIGIKGKLVTMFHGYDIRLGLEKGGKFYDQLFKTGDKFLVISDYNYRNLISFGADPRKLVTLPVGININDFAFKWNEAFVLPENINIITVARLVEEKGLHYGIKAIKDVIKSNPDVSIQYHIIGEGRLEKPLQRYIDKLSLSNCVHLLGSMTQEDIIKNLRKSHIFLLPSVAEALPVSLMEAQCVGLPVIATSVGSVSQVVVDGKSGFLVKKGDVKAITERLNWLISHPERWREMGKEGRKFIVENYDIIKLNSRLVEIYEELLTKEKF